MKPIGDGTDQSGLFTDLRIGKQFANAVLHFLRDHKRAIERPNGIELPINEETWQDLFQQEFPKRDKRPAAGWVQSLKDYCDYYNQGTHDLGYDKDGLVDFGTGRRVGKQSKGQSICGTKKAVHPGSQSYVTTLQVIRIVRKRITEIPTERDRRIRKKLLEARKRVASKGFFEPNNQEDARKRTAVAIVQRHGQSGFREELLEAYGYRCAVTGCNVVWALEAAHIKPYRGRHTSHVKNGLLLRADIHTLFDLNLLGIDPDSLKVHLATPLRGSFLHFA